MLVWEPSGIKTPFFEKAGGKKMGEKAMKDMGPMVLDVNTAVSKMLKDVGKERITNGGW